MSHSEKSVLVVEDNEEVRIRISKAISNAPDLTLMGSAGSIKEAKAILDRGLPSVALVDLGLPDGGGEAIIAWLRQHAPQVETLVLTVFADERHVISAIQSGASGYLLKCDAANSILSNIKLVLEGQSPISPAVARHILNSTRKDNHDGTATSSADATEEPEKPRLTPTEVDVLKYIAKGFTGPEIATITGKSVNTVPVHIKNIYRKLSVSARGEAVFQAIQLGLISADQS